MEIKAFLDYLSLERNMSPRTVGEYGDDLAAFEGFFRALDASLTWESVGADVVRCWLEDMMDRGNAATSVNRRLSALRSFYRFALSRNLVARDPAHAVAGPRKERPLPQYLREGEVDALLDVGLCDPGSYVDLRARTEIMTFYEAGLRVGELCSLDEADVDLVACRMRVTGKRDKQRIVPFGPELRDALALYAMERDLRVGRKSGAMFLSSRGERMSHSQVRRDVSKWVSRVSTLTKRSPHVLRHTFATAMLNNGASLEAVKRLLGHESLTTTEIYTHTTFGQLRKVYDSAHPRARKP